jgi:hypothetical protein
MNHRQYLAVIASPIAIFTIVLAFVNGNFVDLSKDQIGNIKIHVIYSGTWEGVLISNEKVQMVSGFTRKTIIVVRPEEGEWTVSFEAEKIDDSLNQLKVVIELINGTRLDEAQIIDPYGKVALALTIG